MSRFLRRTATKGEPAADTPSIASTTQTTESRPSQSSGPASPSTTPLVEPPPKAPTRRGSRGGRGRNRGGGNGAANTSAANQTPEPREPRPSGRSNPRRAKPEPEAQLPTDPAEKMLALLERQTVLLEQQGAALEQLAASQQLLTQTLLGQSGDDTVPARIEVLPRLAIFVDVPNILYGAEASGVRLNWGKVADFLSHGRTLVRAIAYSPISDDPSARTENERFVVPFLDHGYRIATKQLKRFSGGSVKANFDVELAIDVLTMSDRVDVIVLVSGDGDFRRLVEIVGARGVRVEVMAFGQSTSADLRQVADRYIDIAQYADQLRD